MRLIIEEIEGPYYIDIVLSPEEFDRMKYGEMIDGYHQFHGKRFYIGVRLKGKHDYETENEEREEDY